MEEKKGFFFVFYGDEIFIGLIREWNVFVVIGSIR